MIRNEKGSAVALVMMVLGIVSLLGVAMLSQSHMDMQLTSSMRSYDKMSSVADGAAAIAFHDLQTRNLNLAYSGDVKSSFVKDNSNPPTDLNNKTLSDASGGKEKFSSQVLLAGYSDTPEDAAGWEVSRYYPEFWIGQGTATRDNVFGGSSCSVRVAVTKIKIKD